MNIRTLRYLAAIEQYGSLSEAADRLYISQPYLSRILRDTEEQFRLTIFTRGRDGLQVTEQGRLFLDMAQELIREADRFEHTFGAPSQTAALKISAFPTSYAIDACMRMLQDMPEQPLRFQYKEGSTTDVIQDVHAREADLGIIFLKERNWPINEAFFKSRRIVCQKLFDTRPHVLVREGHPLTRVEGFRLEELYRYGLVMFQSRPCTGVAGLEDGYYNDRSIPELVDFSRFTQIVSIRSRATMHNILGQTDYIALGNQIAAEPMEPFGLCALPFPFPEGVQDPDRYSNSLYCIHLKDRPLSGMAKRYVEYLSGMGRP